MSLERRLFVVVSVARGGVYESMTALADAIRDEAPPEFTYRRLGETYVNRRESIIEYISICRHLELITTGNKGELRSFSGNKAPKFDGFVDVLTRRSVEYLENNGFSRAQLVAAVKHLLQSEDVTLPSWREVYGFLALPIPETRFYRLVSIEGVMRELGYTFVTRRMILPASGE